MISARKMAAALVAGAGISCVAYTATAEESGTLRIVRTYRSGLHHDRPWRRTRHRRHPGGRVATILQSSGGPFVEGTHDRATCVVYIKRSEAGYDPDESSGDTS